VASVQDNTNSPRGVRRKPGGKLQNTSRIHADALKLDVSSQALQIPRIALNGGQSIPQIGLGTWQIDEAQVPQIVEAAIGCGYRLIDTAANYCNESGIGSALSESRLPREEFFVTTKLWNDSHGYDQTLRAFDASASKLKLDVVDLYLIHWPLPQLGQYVDTWRAFIELRKQGRVKSIGVSNFTVRQLERIIGETGVVPALNQVEMHPAFQQRSLRETHQRYGIVTEAWSPLGQGQSLNNPTLRMIADRHRRTPAQIILRWHIECGAVTVPRSVTSSHLAENMDVFTFALTSEDQEAILALDSATGRVGYDPGTQGW
jgi:2,5-diketo-D-gluconate reductase A